MAAPALIRLSKSCISSLEKLEVGSVLDAEQLGMGATVQKFEEKLSSFFNRDTVCVSSGTAGIHLALQACGIGEGDEVLVPSLTYVATFQAIGASGAKAVPCDIDPENCLLSLRDAEARITAQTRAIIPVHYTGGVGPLAELYDLARRHGLRVIEDAAHAFGTHYKGELIGGFGDIACFSFDGIKNITAGEGGCITSRDPTVLHNVSVARLLGVEGDSEKRYSNQRSWNFTVSQQGWRYHMSNIHAAIGLAQLHRFPEFQRKRRELARYYDNAFAHDEKVSVLPRNYDDVTPHIYVTRIKGLRDKDALRQALLEKNIETGSHYQPNHLLKFFINDAGISLPHTERVFPELLSLPLHPDLSPSDLDIVVKTLQEVLRDN